MDKLVSELVTEAQERSKAIEEGKQLWICLAGPPGGGKSTLSREVAAGLKMVAVPAQVVPMDGFHFYRSELDAMPDPAAAHSRRGSHWTFDAVKLIKSLKELRQKCTGSLPSFDHAVGDPVQNSIVVDLTTKVVIVEGNYLLLYDVEPWNELEALFDMKWFISCEEAVLRERVIMRNSKAWGWDYDRTAERIDSNDVPNARQVAETAKHADRVIVSTYDDNLDDCK